MSLYTGRYPGRTEAGLQEPLEGDEVGLEPDHPTLASLLRDTGYTTSMIGKWHCGELPTYGPTKSGWDEFFGNSGGALEYYSKLGTSGEHDVWEGDEPAEDSRYYTRVLTERAKEFIARDHHRPWLLNLNYSAVHWPWVAEGDHEEAARIAALVQAFPDRATLLLNHRDGGSLDTYRTMVEGLDAAIGEVLEVLDETGQAENTVVVFSSDNGGERFSYSWPMTGGKGDLTEGGIRVPTILRWPARIAGEQVSDVPVFTPDWTATLLAVAGAKPDPAHPLDGVDLSDHLLHGAVPPVRDLFWRQDGERALRRGPWKYHRKHVESLFDLGTDVHEQANRALHEPELLAELRTAWEDVDATLLPYPEKEEER